MNYQQWKPLDDDMPIGVPLAINTGGYIFRGVAGISPRDGTFIIEGPYQKSYPLAEIKTWSWSDTEPEQEMLMVKPHGIFAAHWWNEIGHLLNIVADNEIKLFVEIGILDGGLTSLFLDRTRYFGDFRYVGINLGLQHVDSRIARQAQDIYFECSRFSEPPQFQLYDIDAWKPESVELVARAINDREWTGRAMVYCDGGDKNREAHLYWTILRPGDLLGVHDYSDDPNSKGPEVYYSDLADIIGAGRRLGADALRDTRILLVEKT